jgi:crossover junction endodeoxyribonuclease RuvC
MLRRSGGLFNSVSALRIVGLDLSLTSPGLAIIEDGQLKNATALKVHTTFRGAERLNIIEKWVLSAIPGNFEPEADLAAIEGYSFGAKNAREALGELGGVIRLALYRSGIPYVEIAPTAWRKKLTGKGNLSKDMVGDTLRMKYRAQLGDYEFPTLDAMEAWAVAYSAWLDIPQSAVKEAK